LYQSNSIDWFVEYGQLVEMPISEFFNNISAETLTPVFGRNQNPMMSELKSHTTGLTQSEPKRA
jgi:hypothetical protein